LTKRRSVDKIVFGRFLSGVLGLKGYDLTEKVMILQIWSNFKLE